MLRDGTLFSQQLKRAWLAHSRHPNFTNFETPPRRRLALRHEWNLLVVSALHNFYLVCVPRA